MIIERIKNAIERMLPKKADGRLRLHLGTISSILVQGRSMNCRFSPKGSTTFCNYAVLWKNQNKTLELVPLQEPNPHIVIVGMSGFGKSTLLRSMLMEMGGCGIPAIVFDAHDEHGQGISSFGGKVHDARYSSINILDLDGSSVAARISELTGLLKSVYSLGYVQAMKLGQCLWYTYRKAGARGREATSLARTPTARDLMKEFDIFIRNARTPSERNMLIHLKGRLSTLDSSAFQKSYIDLQSLRHGINSFSLGTMRSEEMRLIYIHELLRRLYQGMKQNEKERGVSMYIVIDEAEFLINSEGSGSEIISQLIGEGRKYGVGVILATHTAGSLSKQIIANASTFISFYSREPTDLNYIANILSGGMQEKAIAIKGKLHSLKVNEAMLISGRFREPVVFGTQKAYPIAVPPQPIKDNPSLAARLLKLARHPIRLQELKREAGDVSAEELSSLGIENTTTNINNTEEQWCMSRKRSLSLEHEIYITKISELLSSRGIENRIIDNSNGPDIAAYLNGEKVAIEYETGRKRINETINMLYRRLAHYGRVIVFVNDAYFDAYSRALAPCKKAEVRSASSIESTIALLASSQGSDYHGPL